MPIVFFEGKESICIKLCILLKNNMRNWHCNVLYITKEKHSTYLYYVSYIHLFYAITKKIIHHSNQGEWMEIGDKGGNVR